MSVVRRVQPYSYQLFLLGLIPLAFVLDMQTRTIGQQNLLGVGAWIILFAWTRLSPPQERRQVWIMVAIATCVEVWSSMIWGIYRYRFDNVPLFVPPGHGMVYLFALRSARTPFVQAHRTLVTRAALVAARQVSVEQRALELRELAVDPQRRPETGACTELSP